MSIRNTIYLVCEQHRKVDDALVIGTRERGTYVPSTFQSDSSRRRWFGEHAGCGKGDHFLLAYGKPQNWDFAERADGTLAGAVRLALAVPEPEA